MRIPPLLLLVSLAGCLSSGDHECLGEDGVTVVCASHSECRSIDGHAVCAGADQLAQCADLAEGTSCGVGVGVCRGGICLPIACGDGRVDFPEQCEPPGTSQCSADCLSDLRCGNGLVDAITGEICDDGNTDPHDGCDDQCQPEVPRWMSMSADLPTPRVDVAMAYDAPRGTIVLFGGAMFAGSPPSSDTWIYELDTWRRAQPLNSPAARSGHAMAYDGDTQRVYLYGGENGSQKLGDFWAWDGLTWHFLAPNDMEMRPPPLSHAAMAYDAHRKRLVLVGGDLGTGATGQTWEYDGTRWALAPIPSIEPRARLALAYDARRSRLVLFGGATADLSQVYGELREWGGESTGWSVAGSGGPKPAFSAMMGFDGKEVVVIGGIGADAKLGLSYVWDGAGWTSHTGAPVVAGAAIAFLPPASLLVFGGAVTNGNTAFAPAPSPPGSTPSNVSWTWQSDATWQNPPTTPLQDARGAVALDPDRGQGLLFGGIGASSVKLFELVDGIWRPDATLSLVNMQPSARAGAAGAFDEQQHELVVFGGETTDPTDAAWTFTWKADWQIASTSGPPALAHHAMAYDAALGEVVMFGGQVEGMPADARTWIWREHAWTALDPPAALLPRSAHVMGYDRAHAQVVMFGGTVDGSLTNETWLFDATGWHLAAHPVGAAWPSARTGAAMAWDPARKRIVMVGGESQFLEQDTWEWTGAAWTQVPVLPPPPRTAGLLVGTSDGVMLSGGVPRYDEADATNAASDVWLLRYEGARPGSTCRDTTDDDGDGKAGCDDPDCWLACRPGCPPGDPCTLGNRCGDGNCAFPAETAALCPLDHCSRVAVCGDGTCGDLETTTCPGDCP